MNFGQFLTYKGTNLDLVKSYATEGSGNLIFAEITGGDNQGFYIFGGKAQGLMVTKDVFDAYKKGIETRIAELERLADMPKVKVQATDTEGNPLFEADGKTPVMVDGDKQMTVKEYVASVIAALQLGDASKLGTTITVRAAGTAVDNLLPTEKAVRDAIDSAISALGTVLEFKGVLATKPATDTYKHGDFIIVNGVEYVLVETTTTNEGGGTVTTKAWEEIGEVSTADAVTSIGGLAGVVNIANGLVATAEGNKISIDLEQISYAPVFTEKVDGEDTPVDYSKIFGEEGDAGVTNVKAALDDLYKDHKVIAASLNDHNSRIAALEALDHTHPTVSGDATTFTTVTETKDGEEVTDYKVSNTLAVHVEGEEGKEGYVAPVAGLATDAYVAEAIRRALAWQVITDPVTPEEPAE
jgi:hypothetical protein